MDRVGNFSRIAPGPAGCPRAIAFFLPCVSRDMPRMRRASRCGVSATP